MTDGLKGWLGGFRTSLTHAGERQPLHRVALAVVVLLDVFILVSIFDGLDVHTRQLSTPEDQVPGLCREIVLESGWTPANRLVRLSGVLGRRGRFTAPEERRGAVHPACARITALIDAIAADEELARAFEVHGRLRAEIRDIEQELSRLAGAYDTQLLEAIAKREAGTPDAGAIQAGVHARTQALEAARARLSSVEGRLAQAEPVAELFVRIDAVGDPERASLAAHLRRIERWFPVKRLGMQLVFLLPLVAVFWAWSTASARKGRGLQRLVSSHLLVIASIPLLFRIVEAVYDVLPKRLLARLLKLLEALNLVALWHYLVMALAVALALALVVLVQRKLFSRERLLERRISRGQCQDCGKPLPAGARACPFCGFGQYRPCGRCREIAHVHAAHCQACGAPAAG